MASPRTLTRGTPAVHDGAVPLPTDTTLAWPPPSHETFQAETAEALAWWSGDIEALEAVYQTKRREKPRPSRRFWERPGPTAGQRDTRVHVPLAGDLAQAAADLLFGDEPTFEAGEAQARLDELTADLDLGTTLLEAAEVASGLGGCYLLPTWDTAVSDEPILTTIHAHRAVPTWRYDRLFEVTFWRELDAEYASSGKVVTRLLEHHSPGRIEYGLYVGSDTRLGVRVPLSRRPETAALDDEVNLAALFGEAVLLPSYVANVRPNRRHLGVPLGRPDTQGCESLMDALDEAMTSWMRDIRLGKARVIVPDQFLSRRGRGDGAWFDVDREVFSPLDIDPSDVAAAGITPVEFKIRTDEHAETVTALVAQIARTSGYNPQTLGLPDDGVAATATEIDAREGMSRRTTARKQRYWRPQVAHGAEMLLRIDRGVFGRPTPVVRPSVSFAEPAEPVSRLASTLNMLAQARSASIETRVRMLNPEWENDRVAAEVAAIKAEEGVVDDPTGGFV